MKMLAICMAAWVSTRIMAALLSPKRRGNKLPLHLAKIILLVFCRTTGELMNPEMDLCLPRF